ncbi:uncharacterized protein LOC116843671 [Odontomachus brunneus]|uniref:uncharacterized protein LOC116843671 n=1 Tax=Odontomachus brunneus TaxID=486640 RepID=UPI0013F1EE13|nr:uncharacterized protein LOC116843671 [Odontomachus brunneus]
MNLRNNFNILSVLVLIRLCFFLDAIAINRNNAAARGLLIYRTISVTQRSCNCPMSFSCSCCQSVIILYTKREKNLCVNFTYQRNGLNIDATLNSDTISTRTVTNYKAFQFCVFVPGCLFSTACVNILQLSQFPKSITACLRLDIYAKKQLWQINYNCINVLTELPTIPTNITLRMTNRQNEGNTLIEYRPTEELSMTESTTRIVTEQMMTMRMSEVNSAGTVGITGQANGTTEVLETSSDQTEQMIVD